MKRAVVLGAGIQGACAALALAQDGYRAMRTYPHVIAFPATAIFFTILSFNTLGNYLRDILDPKQR